MGDVKLHLKNGKREISIEGSIQDAQALLSAYWTVSPAFDLTEDDDDHEDGAARAAPAGAAAGGVAAKPAKKRVRRASPTTGEGKVGGTHDSNAFANKVKQDPRFDRINRKIILGSPGVWDRVGFVCWYANEALTSGDIKRALEAMNIRMDTPRVSRALKENLGKFITSEQRLNGTIPRYQMTAPALAEYEAWFNADT